MPSATSLKRKAPSTANGQKKSASKRPAVVEEASNSDEDSLDGDDQPGDADAAAAALWNDPMIDLPGSPASSEDEDEIEGEAEGETESDFGDEEDTMPEAGPSQPRKKSLYAPPTLEELDTLRSNEASGGTNLSLQVDALLESTLLSVAPSPQLKTILSSIHSHLLSLPSLPSVSPRKAVARLKGVTIPFPGPDEFNPLNQDDEVKWVLGWDKPEEILVGGSWGVCGGYKKGKGAAGGVDLVVIMPESLFSPKDRMSYRYFHKRAHYMAVVLSALSKLARSQGSPLHGCEVEWQDVHDDGRRMAIVITAGKGQGLKYSTEIRIHAGVSPSVFPPSTLQPSKCQLRHSSLSAETPTPLYASAILSDTLYKAHLLHLNRLSQTLTQTRAVDSFLALWRIWASRRGISRERGGSGWFASMLLGWVVYGGETTVGKENNLKSISGLGKSLGYWSAIRAAWEFLAHTDFTKSPCFIACSGDRTIPQAEFLRSKQPTLVDSTGSINVFAAWDQGDVELLQQHARETLAMLEDTSADHFPHVFLRDYQSGVIAFDEAITVDVSSAEWEGELHSRSERPSKQLLATSIASILRQGLNDRVKLVHVSHPTAESLSISVNFNSSAATRVLDVGPTDDKPVEAEAFRQLWGEKAELRRFKDGSIAESVVWDLTRPEEAALIPSRIIKWLLQRHFSISDKSIRCLSAGAEWLRIVQVPSTAREAVAVAGSEKQGFRPIMTAYDDLYKLLKSIDSEMPLAILQVQPASENLRYSSTFIPHPIDLDRLPGSPDCLKWVDWAEVILQFESSPRWPDDLAAVQKVKLAMMDKLCRIVTSQRKGSKATIVFDSDRSEIEDRASIEIVLPQGVAFRVRIYHERERTLLERIIDDDVPTFGTSLPQPPKRMAVPALALHMRQFIHSPQHHSKLAPMHHRYPSYSSATRLLKRWFSSHMLSTQVDNNAIELIMMKVYLDSESLSTPSSAATGFLRSIKMLAEWDSKAEPLYVANMNGQASSSGSKHRFDPSKRAIAQKVFEERRRKEKDISGDHAGAWIIVTEDDLLGLRWSEKVSRVIASRVKILAKATIQAVERSSTAETGRINVQALFTTPTADYDVLIKLNPELITRYAQAVQPAVGLWEEGTKFRTVSSGGVAYGDEVRIGFDPTGSLVKDIQRLYGDTILVFHDVNGGDTIGLLWNPAKSQSRSLKPFLGYSTRPVKSESALVELDKSGILGEIARLGTGLSESITVQKS